MHDPRTNVSTFCCAPKADATGVCLPDTEPTQLQPFNFTNYSTTPLFSTDNCSGAIRVELELNTGDVAFDFMSSAYGHLGWDIDGHFRSHGPGHLATASPEYCSALSGCSLNDDGMCECVYEANRVYRQELCLSPGTHLPIVHASKNASPSSHHSPSRGALRKEGSPPRVEAGSWQQGPRPPQRLHAECRLAELFECRLPGRWCCRRRCCW